MDWKHGQTIEEIAPEETIFDGLFEIAIRCRNDSNVCSFSLIAADALELALL